ITTESDDVEVVVKQGGKVVRIIDTKTDKSITLNSGEYELELKGAPAGLKLDIAKATLTRGETVLAKIERVPPPPPAPAATATKVQEFKYPAEIGPFHGFSPKGDCVLITTEKEKELQLWDIATGKRLRSLEGREGTMCPVNFSQDGTKISSANYYPES